MMFIKHILYGGNSRLVYLIRVLILLLSFLFINLPIAVLLIERFTRPTYIPLTVTYVVLPIIFLLLIILQISYFLKLNGIRKQDTTSKH